MKLRAKLTLGSIVMATVLITLVSAVGMANLVQLQLKHTLERAEVINSLATDATIDTLNRQAKQKLSEAVQDPALHLQFVKLLTSYTPIFEISLVSAETNETLASTLGPDHIGRVIYPNYDNFAPLVNGPWLPQIKALMRKEPQSYKLDQPVGPGGNTLLYVRVLVNPTLIWADLKSTLENSAFIALISIAAAVVITFLTSALALRPLGRISRMLDLVARGDYEAGKATPEERG